MFLYKRRLTVSSCCKCGAASEDWKHVMIECPLYQDVRDLSKWGVIVRTDDYVDAGGVLECKERYERVYKFAAIAFERRRMRGNV